MNLQRMIQWLRNPYARSEIPTVTAEEARQFDLLMGELHQNDQQLTASYWSAQADAFMNKMAVQEAAPPTAKAARLGQLKPYLTTLLPLGGLVALGLVLSRPEVPTDTSPSESVPTQGSDDGALAPTATPFEPTAPADPVVVPADSVRRAGDNSASAALSPSKRVRSASSKLRVDKSQATKGATVSRSGEPASTHDAPTSNAPTPSAVEPTPAEASAPVQVTPGSSPAPAPMATERDTFAEQLQALKDADKALKSGNNQSAKAALSRSFSPQFSLHANALRAVLACQTGDVATGKQYLTAQAKSHPNSPYLDRMQRACGPTQNGN